MSTKCSYDAYQSMVEPPQRPSAGAMGTRGALQEASLPKGAINKKMEPE